MSTALTHAELALVVAKVNASFQVHLDAEDFRSANYSISSLKDILLSKVRDELTGEWTSDVAFHKLREAIVQTTSNAAESIHSETELASLYPKKNRRQKMKELDVTMGFPLDILKPNSIAYGVAIFLFFACIPFGIGMDWFFSGIAMLVIALVIFILGKTGNDFKVKTLGHLADHIAWKNYLKQKRGISTISEADIEKKLSQLLN